jgi:hypothetical protein
MVGMSTCFYSAGNYSWVAHMPLLALSFLNAEEKKNRQEIDDAASRRSKLQ